MMNIDIIKTFLNGGDKAKTTNLRIEGNKLFNYQTCIAERNWNNNYGHNFIVNVTKYSKSTTTIQNQLIQLIGSNDSNVEWVAEIPIGTTSLN